MVLIPIIFFSPHRCENKPQKSTKWKEPPRKSKAEPIKDYVIKEDLQMWFWDLDKRKRALTGTLVERK